MRDRDKLREVVSQTGGGGCVSIQGSVGINRSPWYRLVGTQAYGLDVWYAGSLLAPISLLSVEWVSSAQLASLVSPKNNVIAMADRPGVNLLGSDSIRRPRGLIHTSGMKTVNITYESLRKAYVARPSDA